MGLQRLERICKETEKGWGKNAHSQDKLQVCQEMRFFPRVTRSFDTLQVELQSTIQDVQIEFLIFNSVKSIHRLQQEDIRLITLKPLREIHQALRKIFQYVLKLVITKVLQPHWVQCLLWENAVLDCIAMFCSSTYLSVHNLLSASHKKYLLI